MNSKKELLTTAVYNNLPVRNPFSDLNPDQLLFRWWTTGRGSESLRLTEEGKTAFDLAEIEFYDFALIVKNQTELKANKFTVTVGKKVRCPYYIGLKTNQAKSAYIRVYDSKVAMLIELYGNFQDFLDLSK
jgi:hypothetical protein